MSANYRYFFWRRAQEKCKPQAEKRYSAVSTTLA